MYHPVAEAGIPYDDTCQGRYWVQQFSHLLGMPTTCALLLQLMIPFRIFWEVVDDGSCTRVSVPTVGNLCMVQAPVFDMR